MVLRIRQLKIGPEGMLAILLIALATWLRLLLIAWGWPHSNVDEATMGLMALHITAKGERPLFFYGQYYMGTGEAFLGAAFFRLVGISVFTLRLGPVLLFALFLSSMYLLTSLLYTQKLAVLTLVLLSLGSSIMLDTEVVALGGYPELLFCGSLSLLLACWLALTDARYASLRTQLWRWLAYGCWGLVVGLGFWSDFLMLPFILVSGLLLVLFCWRELLKGAVLFLVLGLAIGAFPLIFYNLHAVPGQSTLKVLSYLHSNGHLQLAQLTSHDRIPFGPQIRGMLLTSLPATTGGAPFCFDSYTHFRLAGYLGPEQFPCSIVHGNWSLVSMALAWSLGFLLLWAIATFLTLKNLWKLCVRTPEQSRSPAEQHAVKIYFACLMLLCSAGLTLCLVGTSPMAAAFPANSRYLIGLLVSTPALIGPLWGLSLDKRTLNADRSTSTNHPALALFTLMVNRTTIKFVLKRGVLFLIGFSLRKLTHTLQTSYIMEQVYGS